MDPRTRLCTRLILHQFRLTLLSEKGVSNKTSANKVSYEALYEAPLTRKTRLQSEISKNNDAQGDFFCISAYFMIENYLLISLNYYFFLVKTTSLIRKNEYTICL